MKKYTAWLNAGEVQEVASLFGNHPTLGPATRFLTDLMEFVNATTDGWHCHDTARAAEELMGMLQQAKQNRYGWHNAEADFAPTMKDVERLCNKALSNLRRKNHYQRINVEAYGAKWPVLEKAMQLPLGA